MSWNFKPTPPPIARGCMLKERMSRFDAGRKAHRVTVETGKRLYRYKCPICLGYHVATVRAKRTA